MSGNYQEPEPLTVGDITDEMMDAAYETAGISRTGYAPWKDHLRAALAAALAAAPTVDGWVWCVMHGQPHRPQDDWIIRCTGHTHRTLLLGPEVEA